MLVVGEPWMFESLLGCRSILRLGLDHPEHEIAALRRVAAEELFDRVRLALNISLEQFLKILSGEQVATGHEVEKHGTEREDIRLVGVSLSLEDFGRYVPWGPAFVGQQFVI